jgi:hypothetical protein
LKQLAAAVTEQLVQSDLYLKCRVTVLLVHIQVF